MAADAQALIVGNGCYHVAKGPYQWFSAYQNTLINLSGILLLSRAIGPLDVYCVY